MGINENLKNAGIHVSERQLKNTLAKCIVCLKTNNKRENSCQYIEVQNPGDKLSIDVLEITPTCKILVAIDYFSRFVFAKMQSTKHGDKVVKFLEEIYAKFPFKMLISDNGKEFSNRFVKEWTNKKGLMHKFTTPYYHKSNGRVERVNRTIREAIRKSKGPVKKNLKLLIENYNGMVHRGIGMSPKNAIMRENWDVVRNNVDKYKNEFKKYNKIRTTFQIGDEVLIRNEMKTKKMDEAFKEFGEVLERVHGDVYKIKTKAGKTIRRHESQLKKVEKREVGSR